MFLTRRIASSYLVFRYEMVGWYRMQAFWLKDRPSKY